MNAQRTTVFKLLLSLWMAMHVLASDALAQSGTCANSAGNPQCAAAGNPINVITGNKYQRDVDMAPLPGPLGLEIVRYYNSKLSGVRSRTGILGRGWRLSYEVRLAAIADTVQVVEADGSRLIFARDPLHPNVCSNLDPANGSVEVRRTRDGDEYVWHKSDGRRLSFDTRGNLVQILAPSGEFVSMQHDARGWLVQVTDPQGRSLRLNYLERREAAKGLRFSGVQSIESPVGRFSYRYGSALPKGADSADRREVLANLVEVSMPDATLRRYHFEDPRFPTLLTGISVQAQDAQGKPRMQRYATFGYDGNAMAVLSTHAGGADGITLDNSTGGRTVLTNSLGQKTVYQYGLVAGQLRLQEVRGAGCALCGEMNVRYGYDRLGRISDVTRLDGNGTPLQGSHTDYDYYGRPHLVSRIAYRDGKPAKPEWQQRFEYAAGGALTPILIARPSVVPGREYLTRIRYGTGPANAVLPVEISETGYIPTYDGNGAAQQIARTMRYGYDGNGQRTVTDGPLANAASAPGPDNSDITRTDYDPKTRLPLRTIAPGGRVTEVLERDAALRPVRIRTSDGYRAQTAGIRSNWRGQPEEIRIEAALLVRDGAVEGADGTMVRTFGYRYDAQGRLESMTAPGGLVTRFVYDAAGRLTHRILPDGSRLVTRQDTEGRLASEARYAGDEGAEALASLRYQYDAAGRVSRVDDGLGLVKRVEYTAFDQVARLSNGAGSASRFAYDDHGLLILRTDAAGTPEAASTRMAYDSHGRPVAVTDPNGVRTERRYDDFGRKVFEASPDRGITLYTHDAAGRIMARIDESGFTTRYGYDQAGRLVTMGVDRQAALVRYSYQGQYLVQMTGSPDGDPQHLAERVGYAYDAFGQQVRERRWIARVDDGVPGIKRVAATTGAAGGLTFETEQAFDDAGNLVRRVLPDGHRIEYRYTPTGSAAGAGRPGQLVAILFDGRIVVTDIAQSTAGGLSGYTHGNGVRQRIALDGRGRILELRAETSSRRPAEGALARWWGALRTWMGGSQDRAGERGRDVVYAQMNSYDEADRLTTIVRGTAAAPQTERYGYDGQNRLVHVEGKGGRTDYAYDAGGNRIAEKGAGVDHRYGYQRGSNRLAALTSGDAATPGAPRLDNAWLYHPTGVPVAQLVVAGMQRTASPAAGSRRIEYNGARRPVAVYGGDGRPLARYFYNTQGERMAKVVYGGAGADTTYSLYSDQRLAAETDGAGRITAHYIYLYGRPVAKVSVVPADSLTRRAWRAVRTAGGLLPDARPDAGDSIATVYAIHTDHLGTPRTVTDEDGRPVWQAEADAFGKMRVLYAAPSGSGRPFDMPLRLPGQVYDAETGLNQNYYRDYNPALGRYMTADPAGLAGGTNPYAYVGSNPLTRIDPLGLYQSDVHYYMTYFLAVVAGMSADDARRMALATQYIDNNPATYPLNEENILTIATSIFWNQDNLAKYHFVLWTQDENEKPVFNESTDLGNPLGKSPQLNALLSYADQRDGNNCLVSNKISLQFMGEFLHAFEDSYAHRHADNKPFGVNGGFGHGLYDSDPDYTYNHTGYIVPDKGEIYPIDYVNNEGRTFTMELAVLQQIKDYMKRTNYKSDATQVEVAPADLKEVLGNFNSCHANEGSDKQALKKKGETQSNTASDCKTSGDPGQLGPKIAVLSDALTRWGYPETLKWSPDKNGVLNGYSKDEAEKNREAAFEKLDPKKYPAANLGKDHK